MTEPSCRLNTATDERMAKTRGKLFADQPPALPGPLDKQVYQAGITKLTNHKTSFGQVSKPI